MNNVNLNEDKNAIQNAEVQEVSSRISVQSSVQIQKKVKKAKDAFRTISEVADKLDVQQHVLRFWETKFSQVRPLKRGGGRRYYRPEDVALLSRIHHLLYTEGYTIKGVQKLIKEQGKAAVIAGQVTAVKAQPSTVVEKTVAVQPSQSPAKMPATQRAALEIMLAELKAMRAMINIEKEAA